MSYYNLHVETVRSPRHKLGYNCISSGVDERNNPERPSGTCYLAGTRVPVLIVKSAGTLSTYCSGTKAYLQWAEMTITNL